MYQRDVTRLHRIEIRSEVAGCESLHHDRGGRAVIDSVGQRHQRGGRHDHVLGIASGGIDPRDAFARADRVHALAHGTHTSRALHAEHLGIRHLGPEQTLTHADFHEVHAGGVDLDQGLSRPRCRFRYIHQFEHVRATGPTNSHHPHVSVSVTGRCAMPLTAAVVMKSSV